MLPDTLLTCHVYAQFISLYRQLLTEVIMDEARDSQVAGNYDTALSMRKTKPLSKPLVSFISSKETCFLTAKNNIIEGPGQTPYFT